MYKSDKAILLNFCVHYTEVSLNLILMYTREK